MQFEIELSSPVVMVTIFLVYGLMLNFFSRAQPMLSMKKVLTCTALCD